MPTGEERECGGCTACCFTHSVARAGIPVTKMFEWCGHCTQGVGCSIYENRPGSCRTYKCLWLLDSLDESMRPDRWGIVIDIWEVPGEELKLANFWECVKGRFAAPDIQAMIQGLIATGRYAVAGRPMNRDQPLYFPAGMTDAEKLRFLQAAVQELIQQQDAAAAG